LQVSSKRCRQIPLQSGKRSILHEVGQPSRAWIDYPGHIWAQYWNEGAVYSPDGMTIQFDRGTVWQRDLGVPPVSTKG